MKVDIICEYPPLNKEHFSLLQNIPFENKTIEKFIEKRARELSKKMKYPVLYHREVLQKLAEEVKEKFNIQL